MELELGDLAPRLKELKSWQDELSKIRIQIECEIVASGVKQVDASVIRSRAEDLRSLLKESDFTERKAFLRSFLKQIKLTETRSQYHTTFQRHRRGSLKLDSWFYLLIPLVGQTSLLQNPSKHFLKSP